MMKPPDCHFLQDVLLYMKSQISRHILGKGYPPLAMLLKAPRCLGWVGLFLFTCLCLKVCF